METYFHLETHTNDIQRSIYREVKNIPASELESTTPSGHKHNGSRLKWTNWLRVIPFFKF
ncbi:hypothetical protein [Shimazuella kribbensis]|uniref:hypothetical protein n=1 Tax=Shimazuella kribbensis TaxID=139808 RepID=UPI0003FCC828|nr:hypothetical protein [Shimazuella kribbensis]